MIKQLKHTLMEMQSKMEEEHNVRVQIEEKKCLVIEAQKRMLKVKYVFCINCMA